MGYQERDYYREDETADPWAVANFSLTVKLILANVAVALFAIFFSSENLRITDYLALRADTLWHPLEYWRFLTYGFAHHDRYVGHIVGNMFMLYIVGRDLEEHYGGREFFRFYLAAIVVSGLCWALATAAPFLLARQPVPPIPMVGASGGVMALVVVFCLTFPSRPVRMFFNLPGWVAGVIWLAADLFGAAARSAGGIKVAYEAHAAGALFGLAFVYLGFRFGRWPGWRELVQKVQRLRKPRPPLRVRRSEDFSADEPADLDERADAILAKLHAHGDGSLSPEERRILEAYSRRVRNRRS